MTLVILWFSLARVICLEGPREKSSVRSAMLIRPGGLIDVFWSKKRLVASSKCVQRGLGHYVKYRVNQDPSLVGSNWHRPLLSHASRPSKISGIEFFDTIKTIDFLLVHDANPNAWDWVNVLSSFIRQEFISSKVSRDLGQGIPRSKMGSLLERFLIKESDLNMSVSASAVRGCFLLEFP